MIDKFKLYDTTCMSAFLAAISAGTERVNDLSARLSALAAISGTAALQIAGLSNAAHTMATGQALATRCQCKCEAPTKPPSTVSSLWEKAWKGFFLGAAAIGAAGLWSAAAKRLWAIISAPIVMNGLAAIGRMVTSLRAVEFASEAFVAVAETLGELFAAVAALAASVPIAAMVAAAAHLAGSAYLMWRNWSAIVRAIRRLCAAVSHAAISIMDKLASAVMGEPEGSSTEDSGPAGDAVLRRHARDRLYGLAPSLLASVFASPRPVSSRGFTALNQAQLWSGFQQRPLAVRKAAAIAMLSVPLLAAPAMANLSSGQSRPDTAGSAAIVINSTPTIVINACQPDDIEQRVLEALRQHREAIYVQWSRELQRRQRTEF